MEKISDISCAQHINETTHNNHTHETTHTQTTDDNQDTHNDGELQQLPADTLQLLKELFHIDK